MGVTGAVDDVLAPALALGVVTTERGLDDDNPLPLPPPLLPLMPPTNSRILCNPSENCSRFLFLADAHEPPPPAPAAPVAVLT